MFPTFRLRLLFWFLVFISSSLVVVLLSLGYIRQREEIFANTEAIEEAYLGLLKSVQSQETYFSYETKNGEYFKTGKSIYLDNYNRWFDSTAIIMTHVHFEDQPELQKILMDQKVALGKVDSLFLSLTLKIRIRGYKDYSMEGAMREEAHWLENTYGITQEKILLLRKYEKDYIIRNEQAYVDKLRESVAKIKHGIKINPGIPASHKDSLNYHLDKYEYIFLELVDLDREIGIKDDTGLKKALDEHNLALATGFDLLLRKTHQWAKQEFNELRLYFGITGLLLVTISILISTFIARRITKPLTELTSHITHFVESDFTLESDTPVFKSKDEIGSLTRNFSILKNEVISQMKFFKQRVEERTKELADANTKLAGLSEANSRFVPKEFVQNLGKHSIEEVSLGDQVEREMTVIFTDIRGFTKISEELNAQETFDFLNQYFGGIVPIILKEGGFIDKFIGDSVMALFPGKPDDAIKASLQFEAFTDHFNTRQRITHHMPKIAMGTGIHTGSMILGTIGHDDRLETTVISDAVNTAARVEGLSKFYGAKVIVTRDTVSKLEKGHPYHYRFLDRVKVKEKARQFQYMNFSLPLKN